MSELSREEQPSAKRTNMLQWLKLLNQLRVFMAAAAFPRRVAA